MQLFLYEHVTATCDESHPLYGEGRAMRDAVSADLARIPGAELVPGDFDAAARRAGGCLLIAPETGGVLETLARRVLALGGRLLGPSPDAIRATTDKLALADRWNAAGVPTPPTALAVPGYDTFPAVLKPRDGCGSESTWHVRDAGEYAARLGECRGEMIVQPFLPGEPASVAFLIGPRQTLALPASRQLLSADGRFQYLGGELPLPADLAARALRLGRAAVAAVPGLLGYVGVDLLLGEAGDCAVEINPRLTTSYVGLRAATAANVAEAMLCIADGLPVAKPAWLPGRTAWDAGGRVRRDDADG